MAYSGKFIPKYPQKYVGDYTNIIYRSSWEARVMSHLDKEPYIISWSSEELIIPYVSPIDGRHHRYFPDFLIKYKTKDDLLKTMLVEVKPFKQTNEPERKKKITKQYIQEVTTWGVNQAKWHAAREFCLDRNWEFQIWTERELGFK